jgi:chromosome segregation ATPase
LFLCRNNLATDLQNFKENGTRLVDQLKMQLDGADKEFEDCQHVVVQDDVGGGKEKERGDKDPNAQKSIKELQNMLSSLQQELRHKKEMCETLEELDRKLHRGFDHIAGMLVATDDKFKGVQGTNTFNEVNEGVEMVLDALLEEGEKQRNTAGIGLDSLSQSSRHPSTSNLILVRRLFRIW